jgi:hypothetical protein
MLRVVEAMDHYLRCMSDMNPAIEALKRDVEDLAAALTVLGDAIEQRGDADVRRMVRLLARHTERVQEQIEKLDY